MHWVALYNSIPAEQLSAPQPNNPNTFTQASNQLRCFILLSHTGGCAAVSIGPQLIPVAPCLPPTARFILNQVSYIVHNPDQLLVWDQLVELATCIWTHACTACMGAPIASHGNPP